ncbi:hypothetical protein [Alloyangia pacifica]|uniref:hypothetical protein n=1 Tax=Alloyangia pacifica TaxID=311180 RepID=UPI001CFC6EFB|nr:hypothetical protein [Alloyangia pacifica]
MSFLRTTVTGSIFLPDGSVMPDGANIIFTLRSWDKDADLDALALPGPIIATVEEGSISVQLIRTASTDLQTTYDVGYIYRNQWTQLPVPGRLGVIAISGAGPVDLADILAIPAPVPNVPDALAQALAAAADAMQAVQDANSAALLALVGTGAGFDSVQQLLDSTINYGANSVSHNGETVTLNVAAGDRWSTKEGYAYDVLPLGAMDYHLITEGDVLLKAVPNASGELTYQQFAAVECAADGAGVDSYPQMQACIIAAENIGAKVRHRGRFRSGYLLFAGTADKSVEIYGSGPSDELFFVDPTFARTRRGGFVIGSSREQNRENGLALGLAGTYTNPENSGFAELGLGEYLRDNLGSVQARYTSIHDLRITALHEGGLQGGYAINMVNALGCAAWNIWGDGWTQLLNIGSDVAPATPSCHDCHAWNLFVDTPDQTICYYSIGFIANSTSCTIRDAQANKGSADTTNNNVASMNFCEDCFIEGVRAYNVGTNGNSTGVTVNGSKNSGARRIHIEGAKYAVGVANTQGRTLTAAERSVIEDVTGVSCSEAAVKLAGTFADIRRVNDPNCAATYKILTGAADLECDLRRGQTVETNIAKRIGESIQGDRIHFGTYVERVYQALACDLTIGAANGGTLTYLQDDGAGNLIAMKKLDEFVSLVGIAAYGYFAAGGDTAGAAITVDILKQLAYNSSTAEAAQLVSISSASTAAASDAAADTARTLGYQVSVFDQTEDELLGKAEITNAPVGSRLKSVRVQGYVYS